MPAGCGLTRFPLAAYTPLRDDQVVALLAAYPLGELRGVFPVAGGSVNTNYRLVTETGTVFLRLYEEQGRAGAEREAALLEHLAASGVATPAPLARRDGGRVGELVGKPVALFPWRDGDMRCQASLTAAHLERVGELLARVHAAGDGPAHLDAGRFGPDALSARLDHIAAAPGGLASEAAPLRRALDAALAVRAPSLPEGLVHGDVFRDNVLWRDGDGPPEIAALLDFESASRGRYAYDVMVTLLAWCFGDGLDLRLAGALLRGYTAVRPLSPAEWDGLYAEGLLAALRFTVTRITDYAMRAQAAGSSGAPRVMKDWRRFAARHAALLALGGDGLVASLQRSTENPVS